MYRKYALCQGMTNHTLRFFKKRFALNNVSVMDKIVITEKYFARIQLAQCELKTKFEPAHEELMVLIT